MTRITLFATSLTLALASVAQASPAIPYIPSQWPSDGAFETAASAQPALRMRSVVVTAQTVRQDR